MAPPNLTRVDAQRRASLLDVATYIVELDLTDGSGAPGETTFATTTAVRFTCREPGADSWIDFVGAGVASASRTVSTNAVSIREICTRTRSGPSATELPLASISRRLQVVSA